MIDNQELASRLAYADVLAGAGDDAIQSFLRVARPIAMRSGTTFIREGDTNCDAAYVLISGALQVCETDPKGGEIVVNRVEPVRWVGELALLDGGSGKRNASVRTDGVCELLQVDRDDFRALIKASPALRDKLARRYQDITQDNIAKRSRLFRLLSEGDDTSAQERRTFEAGETVFTKGDPTDGLHYILWGEAEVLPDSPGAPSVRLGPGQSFGHSALVEGSPRTATVRAASALTTLVVTGAHLHRRENQSSDARDYLASMNLNYSLPAGVQGVQYLSLLGGEEALERQYHTKAGRTLKSTFALNSKVFQLSDLSDAGDGRGAQNFEWSDLLLGKERHVTLDGEGHIVGIRSSGDWPQLPNLIEKALLHEPLAREDFVGFARTGAIQTAHLIRHAATDQTVCYCMGVEQAAISAAVARGCATIDDVRRETGCGSVCGGCLPCLSEWFGGQGMMPAVAHRCDHVPGIASFQFYPRQGRYPAPVAGQHLVIDGLIDDRWVSRRYSITSAARAADHVEITVKREPMGLFSGWLFEGPTEGKVFRVSQPTGEKTWNAGAPATVCFVGGIGVTPAISILRTAIAEGKRAPLHIDYSVLDRERSAFTDEIERAAQAHPWFTCTLRETERTGRIQEADVIALARRFPGAAYHLCGPAAFMTFVETTLTGAGVKAEAIKSELFVPSGKPIGATANAGPFWGARRLAYVAAAMVLLTLTPLLTWSADGRRLSIGPLTPGHETLACTGCHETARGTVRQQLQANVRYLFGRRSQPVDFVHRPVTIDTCETCHSMQAAVHAPFKFLEPRYQPIRDTLGPHQCVNCHAEHNATRVSLGDTLLCKACHQTFRMKNDPLDVPHAELAKTGQWTTCMGCHDYHGNHRFKPQTRMAERFPNKTVEDYFKRGPSPYGERKVLATMPKRTNP